ncbi:IS3 family transposase [Spiroplasma endosymbiont of Cantharis nigra]|uniref:IS3 family transposase n=1 Tax=Spiroplasma endosymbiont of Cantharis nigra TaxID=3066278 RepID=UPI0030CA7EE3
MLEVFDIKRSYWDKYKNKIEDSMVNQMHLNNIKIIFKLHRSQFGYRKLTEYLNKLYDKLGIFKINHKKVLRLMKENFIMSIYQKKVRKRIANKVKIKQSTHNYSDLIKRKYFDAKIPLKVLYTDITYLTFRGQTYYQYTIIDRATRQIIDYKIGKRMTVKLVLNNLEDALNKIKKIKKNWVEL